MSEERTAFEQREKKSCLRSKQSCHAAEIAAAQEDADLVKLFLRAEALAALLLAHTRLSKEVPVRP